MEISFSIEKGNIFSVVKWILWPVGLVMWMIQHAKENPGVYRDMIIGLGVIGGGLVGFFAMVITIMIASVESKFSWLAFLVFWGCAAYFFGTLKYVSDN